MLFRLINKQVFNQIIAILICIFQSKFLEAIIKMDDSSDASAFSFGAVQDTFYQNVREDIQIGKLPFNPFLFDLTLTLKTSAAGYQPAGRQYEIQTTVTNIFGRKSKKKNQEDLQKSIQIKHQFLAETMSKSHFAVDSTHQLMDLESKKGTFIWLHRNEPKLLQIGDQFLLNQQTLKVNSINKMNQKIELQISQTKTLSLNPKLFKERFFLIGSNPKCHFVNNKLEPYQIGIDLLSLTLYNLIEDEDCLSSKGTWIKIKQPIKIQGGDLILAYPYVFEVKY